MSTLSNKHPFIINFMPLLQTMIYKKKGNKTPDLRTTIPIPAIISLRFHSCALVQNKSN